MSGALLVLYPGSFDPVTNGHLDIIQRACRLFDRVLVAVSTQVDKRPLFSLEERLEMLREVTAPLRRQVEVEAFDGLLVHYAVNRGAKAVIRGIRAVTDFDYEFQMSLMNRRLCEELETVFLVPAEAYTYLSSSLVKEVAGLGGSVTGLVPSQVERKLEEKLASERDRGKQSGGYRDG